MCVRGYQCVSADIAVEVPVFVCVFSGCGRRVVRFVRLPLKNFMQNDRDFVDVIMLYAVNHAIGRTCRELVALSALVRLVQRPKMIVKIQG